MEYSYEEMEALWQQEEIGILVTFLNQFCENCFKPS